MAAEIPPELLEVSPIDGVTVVRFVNRTILEPSAIEAVGRTLMALVEEDSGRRFVLDFSRVESLTSGMLGKFLALHQAIESGGGRLVFCGVGPFLLQIFTICNIPQAILLLPDEAQAVQALRANIRTIPHPRPWRCPLCAAS